MDTEKKHVIIYTLLSLMLAAAVIFGAYQTSRADEYENDIQMDYERVFTEMVQYIDDLSASLEKSKFVNDPKQMIRLSGEIYRQAAEAKANLALLPLETKPLEKVSEFLSQAGDYAYSLSVKMLEGQAVSEEEYQNLRSLSQYASNLSQSLDGDLEKLYAGTLDLNSAASGAGGSALDNAMGEVEDQFHDYPKLIYDGPFSSHLTDREPIFTQGMAQIDENAAMTAAKSFIGEGREAEITLEDGVLPTYYAVYSGDDEFINVGIAQNGGYLVYLLKDREIGEITLDITEARMKATEFLSQNGYPDMRESYYEIIGSEAVINYAAEQNGYTLYPDLVKMKVALDNGEITGVEARGYLMYHKTRDIPAEKITADQARQKVNPHVEIASVSRAVIPTEGGSEKFCWQIEGRLDNRRCLIYVNTQTGAEEQIFLLIESETGVLAV